MLTYKEQAMTTLEWFTQRVNYFGIKHPEEKNHIELMYKLFEDHLYMLTGDQKIVAEFRAQQSIV